MITGVTMYKPSRKKVSRLLLLTAVLNVPGCSLMQPDPHQTAQEWVGWNIDYLRGRWKNTHPVVLSAKEGGHAYYFRFGTNAHVVTDAWTAPVGQMGNGALVMQNFSQDRYVKARTDCELTFYTDKDEIITRYSMEGSTSQCASYVNSWGGPRKKSLF
jgi:hypothetical protein